MKYVKHHDAQPQTRQPMRAALENAGVDTASYFSLRINKEDLPEGAQLLVQVVDRKTGKRVQIDLGDDQYPVFGKNSRFYGKTMADGHIFNPYIHRRFIAAQFKQLVKRWGMDGIHDGVAKYDWGYAMPLVIKECAKLALLYRRDREAYDERSRFFTLDAVREIVSGYVRAVHSCVDKASVYQGSRFIRGYGRLEDHNVRPFKFRFEKLEQQANSCRSYAELADVLSRFEFLDLRDSSMKLPYSFTRPFIEGGAYYTLKHMIMFEGLRLGGRSERESLDYLRAASRGRQSMLDMYTRFA